MAGDIGNRVSAADARIDWTVPPVFLDQELPAVSHDAELGRRLADKLARVTLRSAEVEVICLHLEVEGRPGADFSERVFVYNYRLYDRHRCSIASLALLTDASPGQRPDRFGYAALGCSMSFRFPVVKLLDYAGREAELATHRNAFALVTLANLKARATRKDMTARADAKWTLIRSLYRRGARASKRDEKRAGRRAGARLAAAP